MPIDPRREPTLLFELGQRTMAEPAAAAAATSVDGPSNAQREANQLLREAYDKQRQAQALLAQKRGAINGMDTGIAEHPERARKNKKHPKRSGLALIGAVAPSTASAVASSAANATNSSGQSSSLISATSSRAFRSPTSSAAAAASGTSKKKKSKLPKPPQKLMRAIGSAVYDWDMIREVCFCCVCRSFGVIVSWCCEGLTWICCGW